MNKKVFWICLVLVVVWVTLFSIYSITNGHPEQIAFPIGAIMVLAVLIACLRYADVKLIKEAFINRKRWPIILLILSFCLSITSVVATVASLAITVISFVNPNPGSIIVMVTVPVSLFCVFSIIVTGKYQINYYKVKNNKM